MREQEEKWTDFSAGELARDVAREIAATDFEGRMDVHVGMRDDGSAEDMWVWFVFPTAEEADRVKRRPEELRERYQVALRGRGFPPGALASMNLRFVSQQEVDAGGGYPRFFTLQENRGPQWPRR